MTPALATIVLDDDDVRVTRWEFAAAGANTGTHVHEYDYLVVPVTGGDFTVTAPDGTTRALSQRAGEPYRGTAGTTHDVASASSTSVSFVEIELKR